MMNAQERDQLNQLLKQLTDVKLTDKNPEAEAMIREAGVRQPDAVYLLVQRCMLLEQALNVAKAKIYELEKQLQQQSSASSTNSFVNNDPWAQTSPQANAVPDARNYQFLRSAAQSNGSGNGPGFLGNIATTAAGVVAGSFLFQGIETLLGHHQSGWNWGQQPGGQPFTEQTVINNYYDDPDQSAVADASDKSRANSDSNDFFDDFGAADSDWI